MKQWIDKRYRAEFVGTLILVVFGVGTAVIAGDKVGVVGIAVAFGFALIGAAYAFGPISGCHINPAVSLGSWVAGRLSGKDMLGYWLAQCLGAIVGAGIVYSIAMGGTAFDIAANGLGQNGWGPGYQGGYTLAAAMTYEFVATWIFVMVVLFSTHRNAQAGFGGLAIGITLVAIHLLGIRITGTSVNPARSLGPALFVRGQAISQLWLFLLAPSLGGGVAGLLTRRLDKQS